MKRFLVLSCSVAISALFFHACSSSDDSMIDGASDKGGCSFGEDRFPR